MGVEDWLTDVCVIENPDSGTADRYGNVTPTYQAGVTVRCRLVEYEERVVSDDRTESVVATRYKLMLPAGVTISERARVSGIVRGDGMTLGGTWHVTAVLARRGRGVHHQTAMVERVG